MKPPHANYLGENISATKKNVHPRKNKSRKEVNKRSAKKETKGQKNLFIIEWYTQTEIFAFAAI